jgi:subfamily B ATP-binding cassette protein MsbA
MIATAATEPVFPAIMKYLLDNGFRTGNDQLVWMIPLGIVVLFVVRSIFVYTSGYLMMWISSRVVTDLRRAMFNKLLTLPTAYSDRQSAGQIISRLVYDVSHISEAATSALVTIIRELLTAIALLSYLLYLDWRLTLITLCVGPLIAFLVKSFSKRMRDASQQSMSAMRETSYVIEETASAQKVVKIYGGQAHQLRQFFEATERFRRAQMKEAIPATATTPITHVAASVAIALIAFLALSQTMGNAGASPGGFVSFITAMLLLIAPLKQLTSVKTNLQRGLAAAENVFAFLDTESEPDQGTRQLARARGEIVFDEVVFSYPESERQAISGLSIRIEPGQTVALVGPSGSGKSTLSLLLPRFYSPQSGRILIDGIDIESITLPSLRANIALVSQEVMLFNDTVRANIAYGGLDDASDEQIVSAAKAANAWEFIQDLPEGLDTIIGDNGSRLSGGQKQRLAIARAILKDAPILVLDEATSALDNESERKVQAALESLMSGRTTLVIAHRLSTIERADQIYVVDSGSIVEHGTHHELLELNGVYAKLLRKDPEYRASHYE